MWACLAAPYYKQTINLSYFSSFCLCGYEKLFHLFIIGPLSSSPQLSWAIKLLGNSGVYWAQIMAIMELRRGHEVSSAFIQQTSHRHNRGRKSHKKCFESASHTSCINFWTQKVSLCSSHKVYAAINNVLSPFMTWAQVSYSYFLIALHN